MKAKQWLQNLLRKRKKQQPKPRPDTPVHPMCRCSIEWKAMEDERVAYRCKTHESKECDGCRECQERGRTKKIYGVTIVLEQIEIEAESEEEATDKATEIFYTDARTLTINDVEVEELEELSEEEE